MSPFTGTTGTRIQPTAPTLGGGTAATVGAAPEVSPPGLLVLGRYRLHRRLGTGGFGTVWLARDERLQRDVAVKVLARERIVDGRFEREARAAARLTHPGIVTLYEAAVDDEGAYLVSELVRGDTLSRLLEAGRLSDRDIVEIGIALCDALAHAHSQGVVHRDVKPSNVLVPEHPGPSGQVAKLTDFGVARLIDGDTLTRTGDVVGTAAYMAPEQADGREAGASADLYSLALVLYEALTGVNPIALAAPAQRARRLGAHLPPVRRQRRDLPGELGHALDLALRPRPRERGSIDELRSELVDVLEQVEDLPGVVEPAWPRRARDMDLGAARGPHRGFEDHEAADPVSATGPPVRWPHRALAGLVAGCVAAWVASRVPAASSAAPAVVGLVAAGLVAALPRVGWLTVAAGLTGLLAVQGRSGAAMVVASMAALPVFLMPRRRTSWPLPAVAVGLGVLSLAGAWPGLAGRGRRVWERAVLGAVAWVWVVAAGFLGGRGLYTSLPGPRTVAWAGSLTVSADQVLSRLFAPAVLAPGLVWGVAAVPVPWIRRCRLPLQLVLASAWSAGLASATAIVLRVAHAGVQARPAAVGLGAVGAWAVVVGPSLFTRWASGLRSTDTAPRTS